jgi:N6-adenosine-specific RNA methylase IME4
MGKYRVILADPPWSYRDKCGSGQRGVAFKYPCMGLDEICRLGPQVTALSDEAAWCFVWAPTTHVAEAWMILAAWGFRALRQRAFTWVKTTMSGGLAWGMGTLTRSNPEDVWCGVRGRPRRVSAAVHSVIMAPRREHSRKPDEIYERIEALCGDVPRVELFSRCARPGWEQGISDQPDFFTPPLQQQQQET